jgi:hypothetical protein
VKFTSLDEVRAAVEAGRSVYWGGAGYSVRIDVSGALVTVCAHNGRTALITPDYGTPKQLAEFGVKP